MKITQPNQNPQTGLGLGAATSGDVSGGLPGDLTVVAIQGTPVCVDTPTIGQLLQFDGTDWCPATVAPASVTVRDIDGSPSVVASVIEIPNGSMDVSGSTATLRYIPSRGAAPQELVTSTDAGAAYAIDCSLGNTWDLTLTTSCTLSISNPPASGTDAHIVVILRQGGAGSCTVTWPASVKWQKTSDGTSGGSAPTLWTAVGAMNVIELSTLDGGTTWGGYYAAASPLTTKGDLWTYSTVNTRIGVGSNGQALVADSTQTTGNKWATAAGDASGSYTALSVDKIKAVAVTDADTTGALLTKTGALTATWQQGSLIVGASDHAHVVSETHLSDGSSGLYTLDETFMTGSVIAWNVTALARLTVTEAAPDQATVSPVGTSGDSIVFDYAAVVV